MVMSESLEELKAIIDNAPSCGTAIEVCFYDYGEDMTLDYLNCENQFYDPDEKRWVDKLLVDNYFHSYRSIKDIKRVIELMERVKTNYEAYVRIESIKQKYNAENKQLKELIKDITENEDLDDCRLLLADKILKGGQ